MQHKLSSYEPTSYLCFVAVWPFGGPASPHLHLDGSPIPLSPVPPGAKIRPEPPVGPLSLQRWRTGVGRRHMLVEKMVVTIVLQIARRPIIDLAR